MQPMQLVQPTPNFNRRRDILLLIFGSLSILGLLVRAAYLAVTGIQFLTLGEMKSLAPTMLDSFAMVFCAGLLLPMLVLTIRHLKGGEIPPANIRPIKFWQEMLLIIAWMVIIILGAVLVSLLKYGWAAAAPLFLLGISLPILNLVWIGAGGLSSGSRRRIWSVFGVSMVGSAIAAVLLEYLVVGIAVIIFTLIATVNPELRTILDQIKNQVANVQGGDIESLLTSLSPYLTNPLVIVTILVFAAGVAPIIEESLKPAVIWFFGKRLRSPAEGFVLGALCGAGFAMMEGLLSASGASQMWAFGVTGRAAASLMHITGTGLLGWGIASARLEKRYGRLVWTYLVSVTIHGLWNGSAIIAVYGALRLAGQGTQADVVGGMLMLAGLGALFLELVLMLTVLPMVNRHLRRSVVLLPAPVQSDIIPPLSTTNSRKTDGLDS